MAQQYPGGVAPTREHGPRSVPVPWDQTHYTSDPSEGIGEAPLDGNLYGRSNAQWREIPVPAVQQQSPWQTNFNYDPNWSGTLRFREIGPRLLAIEGTATPITPPNDDTVAPLGTMPPGYLPIKTIRVPLSAQTANKQGDYVVPGVGTFNPDGSVTVVYGSTNNAGIANFAITGIIPLD